MSTIVLASQPKLKVGKLKQIIANMHDDCDVHIGVDVYGDFENRTIRQQVIATSIERQDHGPGKTIAVVIVSNQN